MKKLSVKELVIATNGKLLCGDENILIDNVVIDSREVNTSSLFIPIIGEIHDAHKFMDNCYQSGCRTFLIDENHTFDKENINLIQVKDTTIAFGSISKYYRNLFDVDCIAVTGSIGKTTTKDMTYSVVNTKYKTLKNLENLNNEIGVPKTLLNLDDTYEKMIIEMGMQHKGEINYLKDLANPRIAIITKIGMAHIEFFENGKQGIFDAKMEVVSTFDDNNILIVNGDDDYLKTLKTKNLKYKLLTYGFDSSNDMYCKKYSISDVANFTIVYQNKEYEFTIPTPAKHNILNAMAAIITGFILDIDYLDIKEGLANYESSKNRMDIFRKDDITFINDSYNANYDSMMAMIDVLSSYETRKVAILGDMYELGKEEENTHKEVGKYLKEKNIDILITVGHISNIINESAIKHGFDKNNSYHYNDKDELLKKINSLIKKNDTVLIKASNGVKLFEIANYYKEK